MIPNQTKLEFFEEKINNFNIEINPKNLRYSKNSSFNIGNNSSRKFSNKNIENNLTATNNNIKNVKSSNQPHFSESDCSDSDLNSHENDCDNEFFNDNFYDEFIKEYKIYFNSKQKSFKTNIANNSILNTSKNCLNNANNNFGDVTIHTTNDLLDANRENMKNQNDVEVEFLIGKANSLYLSNNLDEAIKVLHEIIGFDPNIQEVYSLLSLIYEEKQDMKHSIYFLMIAAHLSQGDSEIWIKCFNLNKKIGNLQQAEYCLSRAVRMEKENPYFLYEKAIINEELNNFKKAATAYKKLLDISDSNSDILIHTANIYDRVLKIPEKAITLLKNHFSKTSQKLIILNKLFNLFINFNRYEEIISFYELYRPDDTDIIGSIGINTDDNDMLKPYIPNTVKEEFIKCCGNIFIMFILNISYLATKYKDIEKSEKNIYLENLFKLIKLLIEKKFNINITENKLETGQKTADNIKNNPEVNNTSKNVSFVSDNSSDKISTETIKITKSHFFKLFNKIFEIFNDHNNMNKFINFYEKLEQEIYLAKENKKSLFTEENFDLNNLNHLQIIDFELELRTNNFEDISDYFCKYQNYEKAIEYLNRALYFNKKNNADLVHLVIKISQILSLKGDYGKSLQILNKAEGDKIQETPELSLTKAEKSMPNKLIKPEETASNLNISGKNYLINKNIFTKNNVSSINNIHEDEDEKNTNNTYNKHIIKEKHLNYDAEKDKNLNRLYDFAFNNSVEEEEKKREKNFLECLIAYDENNNQDNNYEEDNNFGQGNKFEDNYVVNNCEIDLHEGSSNYI